MLGMTFEQSLQSVELVGGSFVIQAQKNDATVRATLFEYLLTEVLVVGDQDPVFGERFSYDIVIVRAASLIED